MHPLAARSQSLKAKSRSNHSQFSPTAAEQPEGGEPRLLGTINPLDQLDGSTGIRGIRVMLEAAQSQRPEKESILWPVEDGSKVRCIAGGARLCRIRGGGVILRPFYPKMRL